MLRFVTNKLTSLIMKKSIYTIIENEALFMLNLKSEEDQLILSSKSFNSFRECEKFLDTLRVHMCFQTNFCRSKNAEGMFGFEIRTCWDDLIAQSKWFSSRADREEAMRLAFDGNKSAVFMHTPMYPSNIHSELEICA